MQANTNRRLLVSLDCMQEYGSDRYLSCGTSRVVEGRRGATVRQSSANVLGSGSSPACGTC